MANYAKEKGVDPSKLRLDDKSTDTKENLAFSQKLFIDPDGKTAVVSTGYHVFRALYLDPSKLRLDDKSTDTKENLAFSQKLFIDPDGKTAVVSTGYHVFRALYLARSEQIPCIGYGAKTKLYFSMNALLREYIGYLSISWKTHLKVLAILLLPFAALTALYYGVQLLV